MSVVKNKFQKAGDFIIENAKIVTSSGIVVDITASIIIITIFEDTEMMAVSGNILMFDTVNLASVGPLIGQEYLKLKISTPSMIHKSAVIDFTENVFLIHSLQSRENVGNNANGYLLNFVSSDIVKNQRTKISQTLKGSYSDIVKNVLINYLYCKKDLYIEPTVGLKKIISPNKTPFDVITMAMNESVSAQGKGGTGGDPTYLFFETMEGYHFRSLTSMYVQEPVLKYTASVGGSKVKRDGTIDALADLQTVLDYEIVSNSDSMVNYRVGIFASKLITHDIFNKTYTTHTYNYLDNFDKESHITGTNSLGKFDWPLYSAVPVEEDGLRVSDFPARTFVLPTSLKDTTLYTDSTHVTSSSTYPYAAYNPHKWLQRRTSQLMQLNQGLMINILVHGNTLINVGDVVELNIPYSGTPTTKNEKHDRFYKGPFFVKRIRHDFDISAGNKHNMYMTLVKDSLEEELDAPEDNFEPKPKIQPTVYEDFYVNTEAGATDD